MECSFTERSHGYKNFSAKLGFRVWVSIAAHVVFDAWVGACLVEVPFRF